MRWTRTDDPFLRNGAVYWNARASQQWDGPTRGAFGDTAAMARAHEHLTWGLAALPAVGRVIEIGCGFGASYAPIRQRYPDAHYTGMDCCTPYIAQAKTTYPGQTWQCDDVQTWVPAERADLVVAVATVSSLEPILPHVIQRAFEQWLAPHGRVLLAEEHWHMILTGAL